MLLANSISLMQQTWQSGKGTGNSLDVPVKRILSNQSQMRQSSSFSRKSIRRSTAEGDVQEVTSFAYYVKDFFNNLFACCGGGGAYGTRDPNGLRHSLNSSIHSNML